MLQKQKVLVLGGSGFIGKRVVQALAASDWAIPVSVSRHAAPAGAAGEPAHLQLDATDAGQVRRALDGAAGIVNCIAGDNSSILESARVLFSAAAELPQRPRIVHLSSLAVYGDAEGDLDEAAVPGGHLSPYGAAKLAAERLATPALSLVILRPGIVYGPGSTQWTTRIAKFLEAHRLGDLGRLGDGYCNLVYIDDTVEAILRALRLPGIDGRIFNLSLPQPPTWNEYLIRYARALGAVPVTRIAKRSLSIETKLLAPPQKILQLVIGKLSPRTARRLPDAMPPSLVRLFSQEIRMKVHAAEHTLGLRWTSLEEGLRQSAQWYLGTARESASATPQR